MTANTVETPAEPTYPGSPAALRAGCTCDPIKNDHGRGEPFNDGANRRIYIAIGCPMHSSFKALGNT